MSKESTSEEKLLKLIRKKSPPTQFGSVPSSEGLQEPVGEVQEKKKESFDLLKFINILLCAATIGFVGFIVYKYFFIGPNPLFFNENVRGSDKESEVVKLNLPNFKAFGNYQVKLAQRDLFQNPWEKKKTDKLDPNVPAEVKNSTKDWKLLGIVLDADPKVVIEDQKTGEASILSEGETIAGSKIIKISEEKVLIQVNGENIELTPLEK